MKIKVSLPPTLNHTYGIANNRLYKKKEALEWQELEGWSLKAAGKQNRAVSVEIDMFLAHDRDIDSSLKLILDTMAQIGVYKNDKQIGLLRVQKFQDLKNPRMEIEVSELK